MGSVAQNAVEDKISKKKRKEVGLDFYRFQRREAQRNGMDSYTPKIIIDFIHTFIFQHSLGFLYFVVLEKVVPSNYWNGDCVCSVIA